VARSMKAFYEVRRPLIESAGRNARFGAAAVGTGAVRGRVERATASAWARALAVRNTALGDAE